MAIFSRNVTMHIILLMIIIIGTVEGRKVQNCGSIGSGGGARGGFNSDKNGVQSGGSGNNIGIGGGGGGSGSTGVGGDVGGRIGGGGSVGGGGGVGNDHNLSLCVYHSTCCS